MRLGRRLLFALAACDVLAVLTAGGCGHETFSSALPDASTDASVDVNSGDGAIDDAVADAANPCGARTCFGGACVDGACQPVTLVTDPGAPYAVAVVGDQLYWTNNSAVGGGVMTGKTDGSNVQLLAPDTSHATTLLVTASAIFWANDTEVRRCDLTGGSRSIVVSGQNFPRGLAVDDTYLYFTTYAGGQLRRVPLGGGTPDPDLAAGLTLPEAVVRDSDGLIVAAQGNTANHGALLFLRDAGAFPPITDQPSASAVVLSGDTIFWANMGTGPYAPPAVWPADAGQGPNGSVRARARDGGAIQLLAELEAYPVALAVDATYVYFANIGAGPSDGTIRRMTRAGLDLKTLADHLARPNSIAVDADSIYWTTLGDTRVWRLTKP